MTEIKLYNTATRKKERFTPLDPDNVRMYVCGPTVYDRAHLGNARPALVFDVLYRLLRHVYGEGHVTYARNITDVDDKINAEAQRRKEAGAEGTLEDLIARRGDHPLVSRGHVRAGCVAARPRAARDRLYRADDRDDRDADREGPCL